MAAHKRLVLHEIRLAVETAIMWKVCGGGFASWAWGLLKGATSCAVCEVSGGSEGA